MIIHVLCTDGSPLGVSVKTIYGDQWRLGVGGSELALLTLCEAWQKRGDEVVLFNSPNEPNASLFEQRNAHEFKAEDERDVLINFRTPNALTPLSKGLKVWWSCDQYTIGSYAGFDSQVDKVVCISPAHALYFKEVYNITKSIVIDLPVREDDYINVPYYEKIPGRLIFTSVPDRGLNVLQKMWKVIKQKVPHASLVITSDYRLWGSHAPLDDAHRMKWLEHVGDGVEYLGAVPRTKLVEEELKADILAYPCTYQELFCITCSEAMYAGAYPITSGMGALSTTNMGTVVSGDVNGSEFAELFIKETVDLLTDKKELKHRQWGVKRLAQERFSIEKILKEWDEKVFK